MIFQAMDKNLILLKKVQCQFNVPFMLEHHSYAALNDVLS